MNFFKKYAFWLVLGVAILLHLAILITSLQRKAFLIDDSIQYLTLAENLSENGIFSQNYQPPFTADVQRAPGYPVFLLILGRNPLLILLFQFALLWTSARLILRILKNRTRPEIAKWVALLYLFQPYAFVFASLLLAETLFITLFLAAGAAWLDFREKGKILPLVTAFIFIALAAYVKPVAFPILLIFAVLGIIYSLRLVRHRWWALALSILIPVLLVAPWLIRNQTISGRATFSVMSEMGMVHGRLGGLEAMRKGESFAEHNLYMAGDSVAALEFGLPNLKSYHGLQHNHETELYHPKITSLTIKHYLKNPFLGTGFQFRAIGQQLIGTGRGWSGKVLGSPILGNLLGGLQLVFNLLMIMGLVYAVYRIRDRVPLTTFVFAITFLVLLFSAAAWADGRYRMILDPLWMVILGWSWFKIRTKS